MIRFLAAALVVAATISAPAAAIAGQDLANQLMHASGMWDQLGQAQSRIGDALSQLPANKTADSLRASAHAAYAPAKLRELASQELASALEARHAPSLLSWYGSPDGIKIRRAEEQATASGLAVDTAGRRGQELLRSAGAPRRRLLEQVLISSRAVEATVEIAAQELIAVRRGVASALAPTSKAPSEPDVKKMVEVQRPMVEKAYRDALLATFALTYHQLPDAALDRYVAFLKSPAGEHFTTVGIRAMTRALSDAAEVMGTGLAARRT